MELFTNNIVFIVVSIIATAAGALYTVIKIIAEIKKSHKADTEKLLQEAKELDNIIKSKLETKISLLEIEVNNLRESVKKDLFNLKENHSVELKNLSEKIENLRNDLQQQHAGILSLLTKLIEK